MPYPSSSNSEKSDGVFRDPLSVSVTGTSPGEGDSANSQSLTKRTSEEDQNGQPRSQKSDRAGSSVESLTQTALAQVPSQLSHVVMSYRTNEWAKHIAAAEFPIYDEPETFDGVGAEPATHLAGSAMEAEQMLPSKADDYKISAPGMATPPVKAGGTGVGIALGPGGNRRSFSDQARRKSGAQVPSRSGSMQSLKGPGTRSSRNSFHADLTTSLITTPIDENAPTEFPQPRSSKRRASAHVPYMTPSQRRTSAPLPSSGGTRPHTSHGSASPSYAGSIYETPPQLNRPATQHNGMPGSVLGTGTGPDSYRPRRPDGKSDIDRRQTLFAEWRLSQQSRATSHGLNGVSAVSAEAARARMRAEKENQKRMEEYQRSAQREKQHAMDQIMRRPDMQELHREAMRRMQAGANNKLRSASG